MESVRDRVIKHYRTGYCDRYGQLPTVDIYSIIKDESEIEELEKLVAINTYRGRFGAYKGFYPWNPFKDKELEKECKAAFAQNPERKNMNQW
jgi:hypothetical protein